MLRGALPVVGIAIGAADEALEIVRAARSRCWRTRDRLVRPGEVGLERDLDLTVEAAGCRSSWPAARWHRGGLAALRTPCSTPPGRASTLTACGSVSVTSAPAGTVVAVEPEREGAEQQARAESAPGGASCQSYAQSNSPRFLVSWSRQSNSTGPLSDEVAGRISRGSRAAPASGTDDAACSWSSTRSGGCVRESRRRPCRSRRASWADRR